MEAVLQKSLLVDGSEGRLGFQNWLRSQFIEICQAEVQEATIVCEAERLIKAGVWDPKVDNDYQGRRVNLFDKLGIGFTDKSVLVDPTWGKLYYRYVDSEGSSTQIFKLSDGRFVIRIFDADGFLKKMSWLEEEFLQ